MEISQRKIVSNARRSANMAKNRVQQFFNYDNADEERIPELKKLIDDVQRLEAEAQKLEADEKNSESKEQKVYEEKRSENNEKRLKEAQRIEAIEGKNAIFNDEIESIKNVINMNTLYMKKREIFKGKFDLIEDSDNNFLKIKNDIELQSQSVNNLGNEIENKSKNKNSIGFIKDAQLNLYINTIKSLDEDYNLLKNISKYKNDINIKNKLNDQIALIKSVLCKHIYDIDSNQIIHNQPMLSNILNIEAPVKLFDYKTLFTEVLLCSKEQLFDKYKNELLYLSKYFDNVENTTLNRLITLTNDIYKSRPNNTIDQNKKLISIITDCNLLISLIKNELKTGAPVKLFDHKTIYTEASLDSKNIMINKYKNEFLNISNYYNNTKDMTLRRLIMLENDVYDLQSDNTIDQNKKINSLLSECNLLLSLITKKKLDSVQIVGAGIDDSSCNLM